MIAELTGTVTQVGATRAVVDLNGFGVLVQITPSTAAALRIGAQTTVSTSLVVREESLTLYGFATGGERDMFELLLTANGVGPKLAQAALAVHGPDELRRAISSNDLTALTAVPGIGRKGAERICIELRDKVTALAGGTEAGAEPAGPIGREAWREQVSEGLQGLGWSAKDADKACVQVEPMVAADPSTPVAVLMRAALQSLAKA